MGPIVSTTSSPLVYIAMGPNSIYNTSSPLVYIAMGPVVSTASSPLVYIAMGPIVSTASSPLVYIAMGPQKTFWLSRNKVTHLQV